MFYCIAVSFNLPFQRGAVTRVLKVLQRVQAGMRSQPPEVCATYCASQEKDCLSRTMERKCWASSMELGRTGCSATGKSDSGIRVVP